jgi:hypothetical protein
MEVDAINSIGTGASLAVLFYVMLLEPLLDWLQANRRERR